MDQRAKHIIRQNLDYETELIFGYNYTINGDVQ